MEFPFRLRIARANCAKPRNECFLWKDAALPMLVDARENRPGWASMSEEELIWAEQGDCIAASSPNVMQIKYTDLNIESCRQ